MKLAHEIDDLQEGDVVMVRYPNHSIMVGILGVINKATNIRGKRHISYIFTAKTFMFRWNGSNHKHVFVSVGSSIHHLGPTCFNQLRSIYKLTQEETLEHLIKETI